ncbi:MAG: WD40/YVTN/BNR-like repeat-containing protein [Betaproteobacteria bacterium]
MPVAASAHDPSAWGGLFRSRDNGGTWFPADAGLFIGGALALAIDPKDPNHLLYGTDTRLLRSKNGGRDWIQEPGAQFDGATYAVRFDDGGKGAIASTARRIYFSEDGSTWADTLAPAGAAPARAIAAGSRRLYLAGDRGVYASDDRGRSWFALSEGLPEGTVIALVMVTRPQEIVLAVIQGGIWASRDSGAAWQSRDAGLPPGRVEALLSSGKLWVAASDRVYASDDAGMSWKPVGKVLPESGTSIRGIAVADAGKSIVLSTHRGILRSTDGGETWLLVEGNLPVHLEAGPLVRDEHDTGTLYAGFSLSPYNEMWRRASGGANLLSHLDPLSLAGGAAFLVLLIVLAGVGVRWLNQIRA